MLELKKLVGLKYLWLSLAVILIDQLSKAWMLDQLILFEPKALFSFLNLTLAYNRGVAFSIFEANALWQHYVLTSFALMTSFIIMIWLYRLERRSSVQSIALSLILGGALANVWDRVQYKHVIDFIDFHLGDWHFAIFNLADSAICIGAILLIFSWYHQKK